MMESEPSAALAATAVPRWVILDHCGESRDSKRTQANTAAYARTFTGQCTWASFRLTAPPGNSNLYVDCPDSPGQHVFDRPELIAAHRDIILFRTRVVRNLYNAGPIEHFMYRAGAPCRPPSLSLLPPYYLPTQFKTVESKRLRRILTWEVTGVLRRGDDELAVVELDPWGGEHELYLLLLGPVNALEWEIKRVPTAGVPGSWVADAVVPIGDRFLCWVDYYVGLVLCDVFDANPVHRYVPLPTAAASARPRDYRDRLSMKQTRTLGVMAGGAVKLVSIDPRCCCGDVVTPESNCQRSRFSFSVTTWILNMDNGMAWTEDGVLYSNELWALPGCELLPRGVAEFPMVSMDKPDAVCLMLRSDERRHIGVDDGDKRIWMIEVDTRKKALLSVVRYASHGNEDINSMTDHCWI